ncbi:unnamed protein product, partial [Polarella glacialis]
ASSRQSGGYSPANAQPQAPVGHWAQGCGYALPHGIVPLMGAFQAHVPMASLGAFMMSGPGTNNTLSDRRVIEVLAAPEQTHRRLLRTARRVPELLLDPD